MRVAGTQAFCWQQACMLQWYPGDPEGTIVFNVRRHGRFEICLMAANGSFYVL